MLHSLDSLSFSVDFSGVYYSVEVIIATIRLLLEILFSL